MGLFDMFKKKVEVKPEPAFVTTVVMKQIKEIKMTKFTFKTREEYLAYKADWKARYAEQILVIRKEKIDFKQANREFSLASKGKSVWDCDVSVRPIHHRLELARSTVHTAKATATGLLVERGESKVEAGRQRELRLQKVA